MLNSLLLKMLNLEASSPRNKPVEIIESLCIREGSTIADLGSGGGYFTLEFARAVGSGGRVYAVDNQLKNLNFIKRRADREGLHNVAFVLATGDRMELPESGLDLVFARNVFHHLPGPANSFRNLKRYLKPDGKAAIIEYKPKGGFNFVTMFKHFTPVDLIHREMEKAGFLLLQSFDFLPRQSFSLFGMKRVEHALMTVR